MRKGFWRTSDTKDWNIEALASEKSYTGYVGLENLGCTCYMNSTLQQLYMIPEFREAILRIAEDSNNEDPEENLLYQL